MYTCNLVCHGIDGFHERLVVVEQCKINLNTLGGRQIEQQHSTTPMTPPNSLAKLGTVDSQIGCNLPKVRTSQTEPRPILRALYVRMPRILHRVWHSDQICFCCR